MLSPRIIPALLLHQQGLVKTTQFNNPQYVGDPLNAVRIFNEKEADELIVLDIDATRDNREPNYEQIRKIAYECRMPLCYGGGIRTVQQAQRIISLGVEKIALGAILHENPSILTELSLEIGSQSVVAIIDVKKSFFKRHTVCYKNGTLSSNYSPSEFAQKLTQLGAGEILLNSVEHDGKMEGYDLELVESVRDVISTPMTILGGAGNINDLSKVVQKFGTIGLAAGSFFVFKGKYRAVLITYPTQDEKKQAGLIS